MGEFPHFLHMKSTLLFICSLLCLLFFAVHITISGLNLTIPPDEAWVQVVNPAEAREYLSGQEKFNFLMGTVVTGVAGIALIAAIISLLFLRKQQILRWFRAGLLLANIIILLTCAGLFCVTLAENMKAEPDCMQLCHPWMNSYWSSAVKHTQQAAMFLSLCCGMLSGVNCMAFYLFYRRRAQYGGFDS